MIGLQIQRSEYLDADAWKAFDAHGAVIACGALNAPTLETGEPRKAAKIVCGYDAYDALRQVFDEAVHG